MRLFELLIICLLFAAVFTSVLARVRTAMAWRIATFSLAGLASLALVLHFAYEGPHWQMLPAYLGVFLLLPLQRAFGLLTLYALALTILLLAVISLLAAAALPIFKLPAPTGAYATGTRMLYFVDPTRTNKPAPSHSAGRDLAVQLWYPSAPSQNRFAAYRMLAESSLGASYMVVTPTSSRQNAPMASGVAPWHVLLFNPAWDSRRGQSTALLEDLASHGYVVAAIDHPGRTGPIRLPDGRRLRVSPDPEVDDLAHSTVERVEAALNREVDKEAADDSFVLDQLARLNRDAQSPLYGRLDTNHAGAMGHSLGGAVAADACALDPRLLSAFSMSAPFFGNVRTTGLAKPYLTIGENVTLATPGALAKMSHADRVDAETDLLDTADEQRLLREFGGYQVTIAGINHSSFTDKAFYSPLRALSGVGDTPRERVLMILRAYAVQFFGKTLEGQPAPLLPPFPSGATEQFPEVTVHIFTPTASTQDVFTQDDSGK